MITFPVDGDGMPIWVPIDARKTSPDQIGLAVRQFGDALWGESVHHFSLSLAYPCIAVYSFRGRIPVTLAPYADIKANPNRYHDHRFVLPAAIDTSDIGDIYLLAECFEKYSKTPWHFQFYDQDLICGVQ